ncbi:hypothetical protein SBA7_250015 [Candidatus Sulfotelmatobacter sp. SbA7]|jgi:hypothetical protein|nr:hypothetical protein SBA7_250015 [Candidatus Sulfotelmatobacter sp. SbA7]
MARENRVESRPLLLRISPAMEQLLEELAGRGLYGRNKAEIASFILREWTWSNTGKLKDHGVDVDHLVKGTGKKATLTARQKGA